MITDAVDREGVTVAGRLTPLHLGNPLVDGGGLSITKPRFGVTYQEVVDASVVGHQETPVSRRKAGGRCTADTTANTSDIGPEET